MIPAAAPAGGHIYIYMYIYIFHRFCCALALDHCDGIGCLAKPYCTSSTPHGASRLVQAMPAWSVKSRRAPSRHCRDARVYGHTTTVMHHNEYM